MSVRRWGIFIVMLVSLILVIPVLSPVAPNALALGQLKFTSTSDFDSGNKSDPGQDYFVSNGVDQPTYSFVSKPAGIYIPALMRTYVVYQGGGDYRPHIVFYDHSALMWSDAVEVNSTNPVSGDGHGAPVLWIDASGFIYVFFGAHATPMQVRRSTVPYEIGSWISLPSPTPLPVPGNQATYPHIFEYGGFLYFFYRQGTAGGDGVWGFRRSNDQGQTWSSYTTILDFRPHGAYISDVIIRGDRAWYSFVWDNRTTIIRHNAYVCQWDLLTNTQFGMNGANLGAVVSLAEADSSCRAAFTGASQSWHVHMKLDPSNSPYLIYINGTGVQSGQYDTWNITFVRWTGFSWSTPSILTNTDGSSSYADLIVSSSTDIEAFVTTSGFRQLDGGDDFSGDIERWTFNGSAWSYRETIMYEARAGNPVNRPFVPLNFHPEIRVVFDSWAPKDLFFPDTRMWAWGSSGFVHRTETPSETQGVETFTDNDQIPNGSFQLANGRGDSFATPSTDAYTYKWSNVPTGDGAGEITSVFSGGLYNVTVDNPGGTGRLGKTLRGSFGVGGSIDFRMKFDVTDPETDGTGTTFFTLCLFTQPDECDTVSGSYYNGTQGVYLIYFTQGTGPLQAVKRVGSTLTQIGTDTSVTCDPCWLRITKTGTTFTFYYSTNGSVWVQDEQQVISQLSQATWYVHATIFSNGVLNGNDWSITGDDYTLLTGTLDGNGYRPLGKWITPNQVWNNEVPSRVTINTTGGSSSRFIDSVDVLDGAGAVVYSDAANRFAASNVITIPGTIQFGLFGANWRVSVNLEGDGTGSISVMEIFIETARNAVVIATTDVPWLLMFFGLITLGLIGAVILKRRRSK